MVSAASGYSVRTFRASRCTRITRPRSQQRHKFTRSYLPPQRATRSPGRVTLACSCGWAEVFPRPQTAQALRKAMSDHLQVEDARWVCTQMNMPAAHTSHVNNAQDKRVSLADYKPGHPEYDARYGAHNKG